MKKVVLNEEQIEKIVSKIADKINKKYKDKVPVIVGVLKGATPFMMDLLKKLTIKCEVDFVQYSSYVGNESSGLVILKKDIETNIKDREVIVVEDIVDTGRTLKKLVEYLQSYQPKSLEVAVLLDKPSRREIEFKCDYVGKVIDNYFVIGYGMDYNEMYRNSPVVYKIDDISDLD